MNQQFSGKLPAFMVMPVTYAIPFAEVTARALILLGLFTRLGLVISGLLLIGLTFGVVMLGQAPTEARFHYSVSQRDQPGIRFRRMRTRSHCTSFMD